MRMHLVLDREFSVVDHFSPLRRGIAPYMGMVSQFFHAVLPFDKSLRLWANGIYHAEQSLPNATLDRSPTKIVAHPENGAGRSDR